MPESVMSRLPMTMNNLEAMKLSVEASEEILDSGMRWLSMGCDMIDSLQVMCMSSMSRVLTGFGCNTSQPVCRFVDIQQQSMKNCFDILKDLFISNLKQLYRERSAELAFIKMFTDQTPAQDWTVAYDDSNVTLDLPSMRVIDISSPVVHRIDNFTVVFAPRAGHHSNIAERVALYLRERGLTRMAVVEQKCAEDIPLYIDGRRHTEDFTSQVGQYTQVLEHLMQST
ncbi:MAG: hypothetical protein JRE21_10625, partial [Deltaproteobacteria bacterium]|nr:hypothetical protein [Deltaproteobacteria bacterium]